MLDQFLEAGDTFINSADVYGVRESERTLAPWLDAAVRSCLRRRCASVYPTRAPSLEIRRASRAMPRRRARIVGDPSLSAAVRVRLPNRSDGRVRGRDVGVAFRAITVERGAAEQHQGHRRGYRHEDADQDLVDDRPRLAAP